MDGRGILNEIRKKKKNAGFDFADFETKTKDIFNVSMCVDLKFWMCDHF